MKQFVLILFFLNSSLCFGALCCSKEMKSEIENKYENSSTLTPSHNDLQASEAKNFFDHAVEIDVKAIANALTSIRRSKNGKNITQTSFSYQLRKVFLSFKKKYKLKSQKLKDWYHLKINQLVKEEVITTEIVEELKKYSIIHDIFRKN